MDNDLTIYLDRLRSGKIQEFNDEVNQDFLHSNDDWLTFCSKLHVTGKVYLADNFLILNLSLNVDYLIPCKICNVKQKQKLTISNFYHSICLDEIKNSQFCPREVIRETILAETPIVFECNGGNCAYRADLKQYLKNGENNGCTKK